MFVEYDMYVNLFKYLQINITYKLILIIPVFFQQFLSILNNNLEKIFTKALINVFKKYENIHLNLFSL
jgi:hypothetical protein